MRNSEKLFLVNFLCATHDFIDLFIDSSLFNNLYGRCSFDHPCSSSLCILEFFISFSEGGTEPCILFKMQKHYGYEQCKIISVPSSKLSLLFSAFCLIIPYILSLALCSPLHWHFYTTIYINSKPCSLSGNSLLYLPHCHLLNWCCEILL